MQDPHSILDVIDRRQSIPRVQPDRPPRELVERVLRAATAAPNHYRTAPWRFVVLAGSAREELGELLATGVLNRQPDAEPAVVARERAKPLRAPVVIAVAAVPSEEPKVVEQEEIAAVAAAVENMLLAAHSLGLGAMWRTGAPAYDPEVKRFLDLPSNAHIIAFVYLGYPDLVPELRPRDADTHVVWRGWDAAGPD